MGEIHQFPTNESLAPEPGEIFCTKCGQLLARCDMGGYHHMVIATEQDHLAEPDPLEVQFLQ